MKSEKIDWRNKDIEELVSLMKKEVPGVRFKFKEDSKKWNLMPKKVEGFVTTIGKTIYFPSRKWLEYKINKKPISLFAVIAHEFSHVFDYVDRLWIFPSKIIFVLIYLFPQFFSVLFLISGFVLGGMYSWWLFLVCFICAIGCAMPLPSIGRRWCELRAYSISMYVRFVYRGYITKGYQNHVTDLMTSMAYYKIMWSKKKAEKLVNECVDFIKKDEIYEFNSRAFSLVDNVLRCENE